MKKPVHKIAIVYSVIVGVVSLAGFSYGAFTLLKFVVSFFTEGETMWGNLPFGTFLVFTGSGGLILSWILATSGRREVDPRVPLISHDSSPSGNVIFVISLVGFFVSIPVLSMVFFFVAGDAADWIRNGIPCIVATLFLIVAMTEPLFRVWLRKRRNNSGRCPKGES